VAISCGLSSALLDKKWC